MHGHEQHQNLLDKILLTTALVMLTPVLLGFCLFLLPTLMFVWPVMLLIALGGAGAAPEVGRPHDDPMVSMPPGMRLAPAH